MTTYTISELITFGFGFFSLCYFELNLMQSNSGTVEITGQLLILTVVFSLFLFQGLKVFFFTVGAIYLVYLVYLLFRAYSELRAMPYFGKGIVWCFVMVKVLACVSFGDAGQGRLQAYKNTTWPDNTLSILQCLSLSCPLFWWRIIY